MEENSNFPFLNDQDLHFSIDKPHLKQIMIAKILTALTSSKK